VDNGRSMKCLCCSDFSHRNLCFNKERARLARAMPPVLVQPLGRLLLGPPQADPLLLSAADGLHRDQSRGGRFMSRAGTPGG
jgi:hypothetical protein